MIKLKRKVVKIWGFWIDDDYNMWSNCSGEEAIKKANTLINCVNCINTVDSIDCENCGGCSNCRECKHCLRCRDCTECFELLDSTGCNFCEISQDLVNKEFVKKENYGELGL